jgi:CheY-like chemotaxis protein
MKILVLEDDPNRITLFKKWFKDHDMDMTDQADQAKMFLDAKIYDVIFLDHDLDGRVYVDSNEKNTGYQVAEHMPKSLNTTTRTIVHSHNSAGAKKMISVIGSNATHGPFGTFDQTII